MTRPIPLRDQTSNWKRYNEGLKQRGSLLIWLDKDMIWLAPKTGRNGRPPVFSDGEWLTRQHGRQRRRQYRKVHLVMDAATGVIRAVEFTLATKVTAQFYPSFWSRSRRMKKTGQ